jgi:hypothetical protein
MSERKKNEVVGSPSPKKMDKVTVSQVSKSRPSSAKKKGKMPKKVHYNLTEHDACRMLMATSQKVEKKGGGVDWIHDPETVDSIRGLMNSQHTYTFRIWAAPVTATVASNVTAGAFLASPIALPEFSGVLSVLFDEYRVDAIHYHIRPIAIGGSTSGFDKYAYAICNDYLGATVPTTWEICLARAESTLRPVCASSGSGFFSYETQPKAAGVGKDAWVFKPPWTMAVGGSASGSLTGYLDVGVQWPGSCLVYAETTATNGTVTLVCWKEFHLSFRMRR